MNHNTLHVFPFRMCDVHKPNLDKRPFGFPFDRKIRMSTNDFYKLRHYFMLLREAFIIDEKPSMIKVRGSGQGGDPPFIKVKNNLKHFLDNLKVFQLQFFFDEARSRPPPRCLLTNVNKKMVFFIEGFHYGAYKSSNLSVPSSQPHPKTNNTFFNTL